MLGRNEPILETVADIGLVLDERRLVLRVMYSASSHSDDTSRLATFNACGWYQCIFIGRFPSLLNVKVLHALSCLA